MTARGGIMFQLRISAWPFVLAFALCALPALGQSTGSISGTVRDASGAPVPGAALTIVNQATGSTKVVTSSGNGGYTVSLPPGVYSVTVSLKGFGRQTRKELKLGASATVTADFALETKLEEEITLTAMTREETVQNTPFSVAAPT